MHAVTLLVLSFISMSSPKAAPAHRLINHARANARDNAPTKIWTNDDVKTLRQESPISIIGTVQSADAGASVPKPIAAAAAGPRLYVKETDPEWYAQEIEARRLEAASAEAQLAQIARTAKTGEGISGAVNLDMQPAGIMLPGTIWVLQKEDREARSEIDALQELGRHSGIAAAAWR
jgi:hypothetical protein